MIERLYVRLSCICGDVAAVICLCSACDAVYSIYVYFQDPLTCFLPYVCFAAFTVWTVPGPNAAVTQRASWSQTRRNQCEMIGYTQRSHTQKDMWSEPSNISTVDMLCTKLLLWLLKADDYFWFILTIIVIFLAPYRLLKFILDEHQFIPVPTRSWLQHLAGGNPWPWVGITV